MPGTVKDNIVRTVAWNETILAIQKGYRRLQEDGTPNQDCRGLLPTNVHTNIIAKFNLRTLADLVAKRQNLRAQGEYADVARRMSEEVLKVHPWTYPFLYPERTQTPALDKLLAEALGQRSPVDAPEINAALKELDTLKATWG